MSARWRRESSGLHACPACRMTSKDTSGASATADCRRRTLTMRSCSATRIRVGRPEPRTWARSSRRIASCSHSRAARGFASTWLSKFALAATGSTFLPFHHQALVDVAHGALVREPCDARIHHRRQHETDLDVERAAHEPRRHQRRVQDETLGRLRASALDRQRNRCPEAEPRNVEVVGACVRRLPRAQRAPVRVPYGRRPAAPIARSRGGRAR